jgi:hypothetical protein
MPPTPQTKQLVVELLIFQALDPIDSAGLQEFNGRIAPLRAPQVFLLMFLAEPSNVGPIRTAGLIAVEFPRHLFAPGVIVNRRSPCYAAIICLAVLKSVSPEAPSNPFVM